MPSARFSRPEICPSYSAKGPVLAQKSFPVMSTRDLAKGLSQVCKAFRHLDPSALCLSSSKSGNLLLLTLLPDVASVQVSVHMCVPRRAFAEERAQALGTSLQQLTRGTDSASGSSSGGFFGTGEEARRQWREQREKLDKEQEPLSIVNSELPTSCVTLYC